jgi:hypothetical protein
LDRSGKPGKQKWPSTNSIFRDNFGERAKKEAQETGASVYKVLCDYAQKVPAGADGLLFLPFLAGERSPHWNSSMRGILFGLSLHHSQAHVIRSLIFRYLLDRNPIIQKVRPEASAHEFYQTQFDRYMHLYWKFQKEFV